MECFSSEKYLKKSMIWKNIRLGQDPILEIIHLVLIRLGIVIWDSTLLNICMYQERAKVYLPVRRERYCLQPETFLRAQYHRPPVS